MAPIRNANGEKRCYKCDTWKPESEFSSDSSRPDNLSHRCKECCLAKKRTGRPTGRPGVNAARDDQGRKQCRICFEWKEESEFGKHRATSDRLESRCRTCNNKRTATQASGNPVRFFRSLAVAHERNGKSRKTSERRRKLMENSCVTPELLMEMLEAQDGLCAVTGVEMTFERGKGRHPTNASIDRIDSSKGYVRQNIRLVCLVVNIMKGGVSDSELLLWCQRVINGPINS